MRFNLFTHKMNVGCFLIKRMLMKVNRGREYLLKYGISPICLRIVYGHSYTPQHITRIWRHMHAIKEIGDMPILPSFGARRMCRLFKTYSNIDIFLTQIWGGGAEMYLHKRLAEEAGYDVAIVVSPSPCSRELLAKVYAQGKLVFEYILPGLDALRQLKGKNCEITINSLVQWHLLKPEGNISNRCLHDCVSQVFALKEYLGAKLTYLVHDYYCICPRITLTDANGRYCRSEISLKDCDACLKRQRGSFVIADDFSIKEWRKDFEQLLKACDEVRTFSEDTCKRIAAVYQGLKLTVVPHSLLCRFNKQPNITKSGIAIGVFGGISRNKGAQEIIALAKYLQKIGREDARIVVVGNLSTEGSEAMPNNIKVSGVYTVKELPEIIEREGINIGFMSSVWPETFSYVTHELIELGLPVVCFDLGAQADAVKQYDHGAVAKAISPEAAWAAILELYEKSRY